MLRHMLLGAGIALIVVSMILGGVNLSESEEISEEEIINQARELGLAFPGEGVRGDFSLEAGVDLEKVVAVEETSKAKQKKKQDKESKKGVLESEEVRVVIERGMNGQEVAEILTDKRLIESKEELITLLDKFDIENRIMAGTYNFSQATSKLEILLTITAR